MPYLIGIHLSLMEVSWLLSSPNRSTCPCVFAAWQWERHSPWGHRRARGHVWEQHLVYRPCPGARSRALSSGPFRGSFPVSFHFVWRLSVFTGEGMKSKAAGGKSSFMGLIFNGIIYLIIYHCQAHNKHFMQGS